MSVEVKNLTKVFGSQRAVDNVSFEAKTGEITGFLGPNGAGKSTTMKIATGYLPANSGTVLINGVDVSLSPKLCQKKIGYLPEHNPLYLDMYVHEYLRFAGEVQGLKGANLNSRVLEVVTQCGLTVEQNKKIGSLSKGYRQRVGLAQALIHDPEVLILDEPTTGLDPNQIVEIRNLLQEVGRNKTVILSTHIMQEVQALCDQVIIINKGVIVANETVESLKSGLEVNTKIQVQYREDVDTSLILNIEGVIGVDQKETLIYEISVEKGRDIRLELFELTKKNNWNLIELKEVQNNMEDVFHQLTQKNV